MQSHIGARAAKRSFFFILLLLAIALRSQAAPAVPQTAQAFAFRHPGIFNTQEELAFIKAKVNGAGDHPMKQGLASLKAWHGAGLDYPIRPEATVKVVASAVGASEQNFRDAAHAAYAHALQWVITADVRHRDKGLQILNGWAATFKGMTPLANHQEDLEAAWALPTWAAAAEIFRHYDKGAAGWLPGDIARFNAMLDILAGYAAYSLVPRRLVNNWATSSCLALMATGVFQDDTAKFNQGLAYLEANLPKTVESTGVIMETCRDCNHAEYNLLGAMAAAEVAWKQGIDFYGRKLEGQAVPRLLMGMEFHAAALLGRPIDAGQSCGPRNCSKDDQKAAGWEMALNHYRHRALVPAPNTLAFVTTQNRPDALKEDHFTGWTTLTHGDLGNIQPSPMAIGPRPPFFAKPGAYGLRDSGFFLVRREGRAFLRYRLVQPYPAGARARLEAYSTLGTRLFATTLTAAEGEIPIPDPAAAALSKGPALYRVFSP